MRFMKTAISSIVVILLLQACTLATSNRVFDPSLLKKTPSNISGRITDGLGPVPGAAVLLYLRKSDYRFHKQPLYVAVTDVNGQFTIKDVKPGIDYVLVVEAIGFFTVIRDPVRIQLGETYEINISIFNTGEPAIFK